MAKVLVMDRDDAMDMLVPAAVVAVTYDKEHHITVLTLVSGREVITALPLEKVTDWMGWTGPDSAAKGE